MSMADAALLGPYRAEIEKDLAERRAEAAQVLREALGALHGAKRSPARPGRSLLRAASLQACSYAVCVTASGCMIIMVQDQVLLSRSVVKAAMSSARKAMCSIRRLSPSAWTIGAGSASIRWITQVSPR